MFNLTKQERSVLLFIGSVVFTGISINYLSKSNPRLKDYIADIPAPRSAPQKINLNHATFEELTGLPGVGPELAQRILDYRKAQGGFNAIEELKKVKGIKDSKFERLKDQVSIE